MVAHSVEDIRGRARRRVPRFIYDVVEGGADGELSAAWNVAAFERIQFAPRPLDGNGAPAIGAELFGSAYNVPFGVAPMGLPDMIWPGTAASIARLSAQIGMPLVVSTGSNLSIEEAADLAGEYMWFQLYTTSSNDVTQDLLKRARAAGLRNLVLTIDVPCSSRRLRDLRNGVSFNFKPTVAQCVNLLRHPRWLTAMLRSGRPRMETLERYQVTSETSKRQRSSQLLANTRVDWQKLEWIRQNWSGNLIVKGVMTAEAAAGIEAVGVDGILVSNHGGRQLDGVAATIEVLPEIRQVLKASTKLFLDGGVRRGSDIVKAYALGADFVFLGRPWLYAAAALGPEGAAALAELLRSEVETVLVHLGCSGMPGPHSGILRGAG